MDPFSQRKFVGFGFLNASQLITSVWVGVKRKVGCSFLLILKIVRWVYKLFLKQWASRRSTGHYQNVIKEYDPTGFHFKHGVESPNSYDTH